MVFGDYCKKLFDIGIFLIVHQGGLIVIEKESFCIAYFQTEVDWQHFKFCFGGTTSQFELELFDVFLIQLIK